MSDTITIERSAVISECGSYRYELTRHWQWNAPQLNFIMLNPSTADADLDDPTIRRCMGFARSNGFGGVRVFNLFALRATHPEILKAHRDPIGPANDAHLATFLEFTGNARGTVLAAWGCHGSLRDRDRQVKASAARHGVTLHCLGMTKDGHPRHPLYVPASFQFVPLAA